MSSAEVHRHDVPQRLFAEQVRLLYAQSAYGLTATLVNAGILAVVLWEPAAPLGVLWWCVSVVAVIGARFALLIAYRRAHPGAGDGRRWAHYFTAGVAATGLLWGLAAAALFPDGRVVHQMVLMITIAGMSAGAVAVLAPYPRAFQIYALLTLLPLSGRLLLQNEAIYGLVSIMVLVFLGVMLGTARRINANIVNSLRLSYENDALIADLEHSKHGLEDANARLLGEIGERERAEQALREGKQFLEGVMDSATNAIFVVDPDHRLVRPNRAVSVLAGRPLEELVGTPIREVFAVTDVAGFDEHLQRALRAGEVSTNFETEMRRADGALRDVAFNLAPLRQGDAVAGVVASAEDITQRKYVDRLKSEFISTVSHELRTPLTSIRGSLGLLTGGAVGDVSGEVQSLISVAEKNSERLIHLINELLDIQKLEAGQLRFDIDTHRLDRLVAHAVQINEGFASHWNVRYELQSPLPQAWVRVDAARFNQVMANLLSNAAKFSPPGDVVAIAVDCVKGMARVSVVDHGPGIANEFRARIFHKFAQADATDARQRGGTGLGLSIAQALVEGMDGHIGFVSEPGRGSCFYVEFPLVQSQIDRDAGAASAVAGQRRGS